MGRWIAAWKERLGGLGKNITLIHWLVGGATFVVGVLVLVAGGLPTSAKLEVGRPAPWDIKAASAVQIVDQSRSGPRSRPPTRSPPSSASAPNR